jgi:general secretion pathway protein D
MSGYGGMAGGGMYGSGMYGGGGYGGMSGGMYGGGSYGSAAGSALPGFSSAVQPGAGSQGSLGSSLSSGSTVGGISTSPGNLTGSYLGAGGYGMGGYGMMPGSTEYGPRVMANGNDNSLLILATPEQHESVVKLLEQLDVPPRQVLIEAQILEVTLTGAFSRGVSAYLQQIGATNPSTVTGSTSSPDRKLIGAFTGTALTLSAGALVSQSHQLFGLLTAQETAGRTKVVSTPRIIATDSIPAYINVGEQVPTLTSQAVTGAQSSGSSLFANTVSNVTTGTTLNLTARINPSGVVTLQIDQEVSSPIPAVAGAAIQSPSFSQRTIKTQVTVQDGDMIAIGGIISETKTDSSSGIPLLHKLPLIGTVFGSKSTTKTRTELVVFLTPHVIYDTNGVSEASDELVEGMKRVQKLIR